MILNETIYYELKNILDPKSIAVIGASKNKDKWGHMVLDSLVKGGYMGGLFAVNPKEKEILGVPSYPSLLDIPQDIDMIDICVPSHTIPEILRQASEKKVKSAVIFSSGFRESGENDLEQEVLAIAKNSNIRIIGPNIQGINYLPTKLTNVAYPLTTKEGCIGIVSQSGSISATLSEWGEKENLGISGLFNLGNQIDFCESDFIEFFLEDSNTKVIALYLEGPSNNKRFKDTLKRAFAKKPIVVLKPGRTDIGKKTAASHTGSIAGDDKVFTFACRQYGIIRKFDMTSFYDTVKIFTIRNYTKGKRVLIITTSGGAGSLAADELVDAGLEIPTLSMDAIKELKTNITLPGVNLKNPLDLTLAPYEIWGRTIEVLKKYEDQFDIYLFALADPIPKIEILVEELSESTDKPICFCYMGSGDCEIEGRNYLNSIGIPVYPSPERAARSLGDLVWYSNAGGNKI